MMSSNMECARFLRDQGRGATARYRRRRLAESSGTVKHPLPIGRPTPVATMPAQPDDRRPPAHGRNPCGRCGARGDLGCDHYAPCVPAREDA